MILQYGKAVGKSQATIAAVELADLTAFIAEIKAELQLCMVRLSLRKNKNMYFIGVCRVIGGRKESYLEMSAVERSNVLA